MNLLKTSLIFCLALSLVLESKVSAQSFQASDLQGIEIQNPTSLDFGPDGRLYVAELSGTIKAFTVTKNGSNNYVVPSNDTEVINLVRQIPNHYDDGTDKPYNIYTNKRQVTGLLATGTPTNPVLYVSSSDNDMGAGDDGDVNLCTNSGVVSKLYRENGQWKKIDLVRGLPRSERDHSPNGMQLHNNTLYISVGGMTNSGAPSKLWVYSSEYVLAAAILSIDLNAVEAIPTKNDPTGNHPYKYDIPTLDDPTRENNPDGTDINDPWGGNDGLNQGKIVENGPVQVFASGLRNAYDILITTTPGMENHMYTIDNGPNRNWGGWPSGEGVGTATNDYPDGEPGSITISNYDALEHIGDLDRYTPGSYYGGHPCPTRANPSGAGLFVHSATGATWRTSKTGANPLPSDWPPVPAGYSNPVEGDFRHSGTEDGALLAFTSSTNGMCEYKASGDMQGDILAAGYDGSIYHIKMDGPSRVLNSVNQDNVDQDIPFAEGFGARPLDITTQGDNEDFPGTVWVASWAGNSIVVFEPQHFDCDLSNPNGDADLDGFTNADEEESGSNPCSGSSKPSDVDGDRISDTRDSDDDNDGIPDVSDYFAIDSENGLATHLPLRYDLYNYDPGTGFFGIGFTGLMNDGATDYLDQFDETKLIAGGAVGALTVEEVSAGDAGGQANSQDYAFQFGVNVSRSTGIFTAGTAIMPLYFNNQTPQDYQSQGMYIGVGDQDNYVKVALNANGGQGGIEVVYENGGNVVSSQYDLPGGIPDGNIDFSVTVDANTGTVTPKYRVNGVTMALGSPFRVEGPLLRAIQDSDKALAVGIIGTSREASLFNASWDYMAVEAGETVNTIDPLVVTPKVTVNAFPNPTRNNIRFIIEGGKGNIYNARVISPDNKQFVINVKGGEGNFKTEELPKGIYFLQVLDKSNKPLSTVRFVKQ